MQIGDKVIVYCIWDSETTPEERDELQGLLYITRGVVINRDEYPDAEGDGPFDISVLLDDDHMVRGYTLVGEKEHVYDEGPYYGGFMARAIIMKG